MSVPNLMMMLVGMAQLNSGGPMKQSVLTSVAAVAMVGLLAQSGGEAGDKNDSPWKPILPAEAYKVLTERSIKAIEETAKANGKNAREKVNVEAAILAGYTLSVETPNADGVAQLRGAALAAAKTKLAKLSDFRGLVTTAPKAAANSSGMDFDLMDMMEIFRGKAKGGEGIHPDLQYQPKLKNLNGIEALIGSLGKKLIAPGDLGKIAKELPNLSYRIATVASITYRQAPKKGAEQWRDLSIKMRDASVVLADAASKKNANGVLIAAQALETTCTACHSEFKGK